MISDDDLEARIWEVTGRSMTGAQVDALKDLFHEFAAELIHRHPRPPQAPQAVCHHTSGTDLFPVIGVLADLLLHLGGSGKDPDTADELAARRRRGAA